MNALNLIRAIRSTIGCPVCRLALAYHAAAKKVHRAYVNKYDYWPTKTRKDIDQRDQHQLASAKHELLAFWWKQKLVGWED